MKRIRRVIEIRCPDCSGLGRIAGTFRMCQTCGGRGVVDRVVVEIVHDDEEVRAR